MDFLAGKYDNVEHGAHHAGVFRAKRPPGRKQGAESSAVLAVRSRVVRGRRAVVSEAEGFFFPFSLFPGLWIARIPLTGEATASSRRTWTSKRRTRTSGRRTRGPQAGQRASTHAAFDADGSGSLDAAEPLDTKKTKGGTRVDSAVHAPQVRGLRQGRRRDGRVLHVRSSRACRCSRRPCSPRSSASAQLGLHEGSAPPPRRVLRPVDAHGRRGGDRGPRSSRRS